MKSKTICAACRAKKQVVAFFLEKVCVDCGRELKLIVRGEDTDSREALLLYINLQGVFISKGAEPIPQDLFDSLSIEQANELAHWLTRISRWNLS